MTDTTRTELRQFVERRFAGTEFTDDLDIFSLGLANSLFSMELVLFIEKLLETQVPNEELSLDNFRTIDAMVALTDRLTAANRPAADRRQPAELG
jgi:methoxymalonate biosynthesis acyl carrier protein